MFLIETQEIWILLIILDLPPILDMFLIQI